MTKHETFEGTMQVMDSSGHTVIRWKKKDEESVKTAKETFEAMTKKGYSAFRMAEDGGKGERMDTFDPTATRVLLVPQLKGG